MKKYDIFISYSRKDSDIAEQVVNVFNTYKSHYVFEYFFDREEIMSRQEYLARIADAIYESKAMLFLASKNSYESEFCSKEILFADKYGVNTHIYCIDNTTPPRKIELLLIDQHFLDLSLCPIEKMAQQVLSDALDVEVKPLSELSVEEIVTNDVQEHDEWNDWGFEAYNNKNYSEAIKWWRKAVERGNKHSQCYLGICYEDGKGVEKDYAEAVKWYQKSADQGFCSAQYHLGLCYEAGRGVPQNYSEAVRWYRKAAEQGLNSAMNLLGLCYNKGRGVSQNYSEAVKWWRKAAIQGNASAQYNLGLCYFKGEGVAQDYSEAMKWFRYLAIQGSANAQYLVGVCYFFGEGVTQNHFEAVKWYRKAASQGHANAQYYLGRCYYTGSGVSQDYSEAVKWYRKAAEQGDEAAQKRLKELGEIF